ncbi:MBOAT, membrane-bound O-acyltransferase family-domain-containing protein [Gaertneriomyces semiglobifer]|nr:MBOAT, membrane-bound O-acyltransferase family-domain-containing protein [Gaertneriomyces semiglobifer]
MTRLASIAGSIGVQVDLLKAAIMLLAAFPAAAVYRLIPARLRVVKHLFSVMLSGGLFCALFNAKGFMQLLGVSLIVHAIVGTFRDKKWCPILVFFITMGQLSVSHLYNQLINTTNASFDHTAPMMVMVIKLSSYAWCAYDGTKDEKDLTPDQRPLAIRKLPSLTEFLGYVFFFGGFLVGPAFEFNDYRKLVNAEPPFDNIPSPIRPAIRTTVSALVAFALFFLYGPTLTFNECFTPSYASLSILQRIGRLQLYGTMARMKYYTAWKLSEAACIISGVGYRGVDPRTGKHDWGRVQNVYIRGFELAPNPKLAIDSWNKNTGLWLRRYIYLRITKANKPGARAAVATYATSAFWHGFRPGFYLTFLSGSLLSVAARTVRRTLRPIFATPGSKGFPYKHIYDFVGWIATFVSLNVLVAPFMVHSVERSLYVWKSVGFFVHVALVSILAMEALGGTRVVKKYGQMNGAEYDVKRRRSSAASASAPTEGTVEKDSKSDSQAAAVSSAISAGITATKLNVRQDDVLRGAMAEIGTPSGRDNQGLGGKDVVVEDSDEERQTDSDGSDNSTEQWIAEKNEL